MLFNSIEYMFFLPIVFIIYWTIKQKYRWMLLLVSSYYFYMSWNAKYVLLILATTMISYLCAVFLEKAENDRQKKICLGIAVGISIFILFLFKYFNFFLNSICLFLQKVSLPIHPLTVKLMLPVGISFYTFQSIGYIIDVYRGDVKAEKHFGQFATYISFFPQLVAGPIERTSNLLPQIKGEHKFNYDKITYGLKIMAWGFYKKIVLADTLALYVDKVYGDITSYKGMTLLLATLFFSIQIYCDFSGYSDIAIGTAKMLDIDLMENFKCPYLSASVKEFWNRWHISLSSWFRDYIYIPLGGNRCSKLKHYRNLFITFLLSGLWHGANWTFIIWGGVHGAAQIVNSNIKTKRMNGIKWLFAVIATFIFCSLAWIFFRANSVGEAIYVFQYALEGISNPLSYIMTAAAELEMNRYRMIYIMGLVMLLFIYDFCSLRFNVIDRISKMNLAIRWGCYIALLLIIIFFSQKGVAAEFVYFQF